MNDFHLIVDHLHHSPDSRHPVFHAPDIRLHKSRPKTKPIKKVKKQFNIRASKQRQNSILVRSAYEGNTTKITKILKKAKKQETKMIQSASVYRKQKHGLHRNSTAKEFQRNAKRLRKKVLDIDALDSRGQTALSWASRQGHEETVSTLLANGARLEHMDLHSGKRPLHHASAGGFLTIVRLLVDHDAELSPQDKRGNTPLILAAQFGHERVVFELLRAGAAWDCTNYQQSDAMLVARRLGNFKVLQVLHEYLESSGKQYNLPALLGPTMEELEANERIKLEQLGPTLKQQLYEMTYSPRRSVLEEGYKKIDEPTSIKEQLNHVRGMSRRHHRHPTGFKRSQTAASLSLDQVRWGADPNDKGINIEKEHNRSIVKTWDEEWGKLPGETNVERLERLGDFHGKIPGQCPHLQRGQDCYSMRELGNCEYLHIPDRPRITISFTKY
jgi:hypothetical protein